MNRRNWIVGLQGLALWIVLGLIVVGGFMAFEATREPRPNAIDRTQVVPMRKPGRLILDVEGIELAIEPGPSGSPLRVRGTYDASAFEFVAEYSGDDGRGWRYRLRLRPQGLYNRVVHRSGPDRSLLITLPKDLPLSIEGEVGVGNTKLELGGLWIVETDLVFGRGDHRIVFSEPLLRPMERLHLDAPMGELTLVELGNASPRAMRIDKNAGDVCVDLRGSWQADATIEVNCGLGRCDLHEPGDGVAVVKVAGGQPSAAEFDLPVIQVSSTSVFRNSVEITRRLGGS